MITTERIYESHGGTKGVRILVDRMWPRGLKREDMNADYWFRDVAPSDALRKWFSHEPEKWEEFKRRYFEELEHNPRVAELLDICSKNDVTLLYSSRERKFNNASALKEYLEKRLGT